MPILAVAATGLWQSRQRAAVRIWLPAITLAIMITLTSKIIFLGWGAGIAELDFTGISGHAMLATSVLPVVFGWLLAGDQQRFSLTGAVIGLLVGAGVGLSRVVLDAHSISEVVAAWVAGLAVSGVTLNALETTTRRPWFVRLSPLVLLLSFSTTISNYLPAHEWETRFALLLSGRDSLYTRHQLMRPDRLIDAPGRTDTRSYEAN